LIRVLSSVRRAVVAFLESRFLFHAVVALLLFVPHLFGSRESPAPYYFGIPRIHSGDEPHYLVFVHSVVEDGDLDLTNNYRAVHEGGNQAGLLFRGSRLDHHSVWFVGDRRVEWRNVFHVDEKDWGKDAAGHWTPTVRPGVAPELLPKREAPWNSPGLAILLAPLFYFVRGSEALEAFATILSGFTIVLASLFWRMLAGAFTEDRRVVNLGVVLAFLGTPAWHYGRSFFSEPYILCLVTAAYALGLARQRYVLAGFALGAVLFLKPIAVLAGVPLGVLYLVRGQVGAAVKLAVPVLVWLVAHLGMNQAVYGAFFHESNSFYPGVPIANALQILGHPIRGLLSTAPIVLVAAAGWGALQRQSREVLAPLAGCLLMFFVAANNQAWSGGFAYSIRFLVPVMPLFCLGLIPLLRSPFARGVAFAGLLSMLISGAAAVQYWRAFDHHPFTYLIPSSSWD
jgi:hypothetical protein